MASSGRFLEFVQRVFVCGCVCVCVCAFLNGLACGAERPIPGWLS